MEKNYTITKNSQDVLKSLVLLNFETAGKFIPVVTGNKMEIFPIMTHYGTINTVDKPTTIGKECRFHVHVNVQDHWQPPSLDDIKLALGMTGKIEIIVSGAGIYVFYRGLRNPTPDEEFVIEAEHSNSRDSHDSLLKEYSFLGRVQFFEWGKDWNVRGTDEDFV